MLAICLAGAADRASCGPVRVRRPRAPRRAARRFAHIAGGQACRPSRTLLAPLVLGAAGLATALSLLGGLLSRYVPAVRAPLDVALDVDNYFREFPRKQIPRARIFARYVALLEHIAAQGCERIVIVAHSQGCVISVETLRWLREGRRLGSAEAPARARLFELLGGDVRLLTAGCPLRQLYAARFPTLYRWVLRKDGVFCGPRAEDIGVRQWLNAYTSGDYVGRWLWSRDGPNDDVLGHPLAEVLDPGALGRGSVYDALRAHPAGRPRSRCGGRGRDLPRRRRAHALLRARPAGGGLADRLPARQPLHGQRDVARRLGRRRALRQVARALARNGRQQHQGGDGTDDDRRGPRPARGADEHDGAATQVAPAGDRTEQRDDRQPQRPGRWRTTASRSTASPRAAAGAAAPASPRSARRRRGRRDPRARP